jgi:cobalt-zinc-cadmium resistance protein CzcA
LVFTLESEAQTIIKLTPEEAVTRALQVNPEMNIARMNTRAAGVMKLSAVDIGQTDINLQRGQINSALIDNYLTITQQFGSPAEKIARSGMLKQDVRVNQVAEELQARRLSARVLFLYYEAVWLQSKIRMYEQQEKLYEGLGKIADVRYKTGESNYLGTLMAEARTEEVRMLLRDLRAARKVNNYAFQTVIFSPDTVSYAPSMDSLTRPALTNTDIRQINGNSLYLLREQQTEFAKKTLRWAGTQFSPSFYVGYFNQSLDHVRGFQGFLINMSLPIWFAPQQTEYKRRKIEYKIAQERQIYTAALLQSSLASSAARLEEVNKRIDYYRNTGLKYADEIEKTSGALYSKGEIEYTELLQNISQAVRIRADYLDQLYECNRLIIKMKYESLND